MQSADRRPSPQFAARIFDSNRNLFPSVIYFFSNKEVVLAKHAGAYKSEKRRKELSRIKKQEERRQRRFHKEDRPASDAEKVEQEEPKPVDP
jgi:hypothetical protein